MCYTYATDIGHDLFIASVTSSYPYMESSCMHQNVTSFWEIINQQCRWSGRCQGGWYIPWNKVQCGSFVMWLFFFFSKFLTKNIPCIALMTVCSTCITGQCERNPLVIGGFPSKRTNNKEYTSILWHYEYIMDIILGMHSRYQAVSYSGELWFSNIFDTCFVVLPNIFFRIPITWVLQILRNEWLQWHFMSVNVSHFTGYSTGCWKVYSC